MFSLIEPLEDRIAPATLVNPFTVTFKDGNGDIAVIKTSKAVFQNAAIANQILGFTTGSVNGSNAVAQDLSFIDFTGTGLSAGDAARIQALAAKTDLTVKVLPRAGSANLPVNVGYIKAADFNFGQFQVTNNIDLGVVTIDGNLERIDVGDSFVDPAVRALNVGSMVNTAAGGFFTSHFLGGAAAIHVSGDVDGASLQMLGSQFGNIGKLRIDGALKGESGDYTGQVIFSGSLGSAVIGQIIGGAGDSSGALAGISSPARQSSIGSVQVIGSADGSTRGDVIGGAGSNAGIITAPVIGSAVVHGSVTGGEGTGSGGIYGSTRIGIVNIGHDVTGGTAGTASVQGSSGAIVSANVGAIRIGGSLIGGNIADPQDAAHTANGSGIITVSGTLGSLRIGHDVTGGTGATSGVISATKLNSLNIAGSITGGDGANSGQLNGAALGNLFIGGNLEGGAGENSGHIAARSVFSSGFHLVPGAIASLHIGGNVQGGTGGGSGDVLVSGRLGTSVIGGGVLGGAGASDSALFKSGYIEAGVISNLTINGSVVAGTNSGAGNLVASSGSIRATNVIGKLVIKGDLQGSTDAGAGGAVTHDAIISAAGALSPIFGAKTDVAIHSISVLGNMDRAEILAGYSPPATAGAGISPRGTAANADAQINSVFIGKNLTAGSIVAGATAGADGFFGNADDAKASGKDVSSIISKISRIVVAGSASGSINPLEHFGLEAEYVVAVSVNGSAVALQPMAHNDNVKLGVPGVSDNLTVHEIGQAAAS